MKTFSTDGRGPLGIFPPDPNPDCAPHSEVTTPPTAPHPADIETADQAEALSVYPQPRTIEFPGREPLDLESISDLWLD